MSQEKVRLLKAFGAEVIITPTAVPPDHPDNYVMMAKRIAKDTPNAILANQFYNDVEPAGALRHHRPGDLGADRRARSRISWRAREPAARSPARAVSQGEEPEDPGHRRRPRSAHCTRTIIAPKVLGEGHPYKVEGIGGDKIPGTLWFD